VQLLAWLPETTEGVLVYSGMLLVWMLGLYVLSRASDRTAWLTFLAMGTFAGYLLGLWAGALSFPDDPRGWAAWLRATWWGGALAPAFWLLLVVSLAADEGPESVQIRLRARFRSIAAAVLLVAGGFVALGMTTDLLLDWDGAYAAIPPVVIGPDPVAWHVPVGPVFVAYQVFLAGALSVAAAALAWLYRQSPRGDPLRARFGGWLVSAVLFLVGGVYMAIASAQLGLSGLPGEVLLIAGMLVMGMNVARYGALLSGEVVAADFRAFALSTLALLTLYAALFTLVPRPAGWTLGERLLLTILLTTHALADRSSRFFDELMFDPQARSLRARLRALADRAVRTQDRIAVLAEVRDALPDVEDFRVLVETALKHLNDLSRLSGEPLLGRTAATLAVDGTALERAVLLRAELEQALERLRPPGAPPTPGVSEGPAAWLHYLVLHEAYVQGRPNKMIMQRYYISESTFHRARRRAVDTVALDLYERLERASPGQSVPRSARTFRT
jgi:hypothetical protein